LAARWLM